MPHSLSAAQLQHMQASYLQQVRQRRLYGTLTLTIFLILLFSGFYLADARNAGGFWGGLDQLFDYPADVFTDAWENRAELPSHLVKFFPSLVETINIAAVSTLIGSIGGALLAFLSVRGLARWPRLVPVFRRLMDMMRAIPEIVVALVLIFVLGGGPVPAMIAISLHSVGALGKLFSETAENADMKPVEGLASAGANWSQCMLLGVLPQVAPNFFSYGLLRFEINIRASAILGFVGAGGIGYELRNAISWGQGKFDDAAAIFALLFGAIILFDQISSRFRNRLVNGSWS